MKSGSPHNDASICLVDKQLLAIHTCMHTQLYSYIAIPYMAYDNDQLSAFYRLDS